jgi:hypothetical protein
LLPILRDASEKLAVALDRFEQLRPTLPEELVIAADDRNRSWWFSECEKDALGNKLFPRDPKEPPGLMAPRRLVDAKTLRAGIHKFDGRTRYGKRMRQTLKLAEKYEAAYRRARKAAKVQQAIDARHVVGRDIVLAMENIRKVPARSPSGILTKAHAIRACHEYGDGHGPYAAFVIGPQLAVDIMAVDLLQPLPAA